MKKIYFILLFTLIAAFQVRGQVVGLKLLRFCPTGLTGAVMKKAFTGELLYMGDPDDEWRGRVSLSIAILKPRMDTFPVYALLDGASGFTVVPGYEVYHQFNIYSLSFGYDYRVWLGKDERFALYPGADILIGGIDMVYDSYYATLIQESYSGGSILAGFKFRAGAEYDLNESAGVFFECTRNVYYLEKSGFFSHNDIGIGFRYTF